MNYTFDRLAMELGRKFNVDLHEMHTTRLDKFSRYSDLERLVQGKDIKICLNNLEFNELGETMKCVDISEMMFDEDCKTVIGNWNDEPDDDIIVSDDDDDMHDDFDHDAYEANCW